jgi:DNA-binding NarL/FixJ family response regulator
MGNKVKQGDGVVDVLVVARPSRFRDGLKAVIQALSWVERVGMVDSWAGIPEYLRRFHPAIVLFDIDELDPITWVEAEKLRSACQHTKCIAIIDRAQQRDVAHAMGVDATLLRGFSTDLLYHTLRTMVVAYDPKVPVTGPLTNLRT